MFGDAVVYDNGYIGSGKTRMKGYDVRWWFFWRWFTESVDQLAFGINGWWQLSIVVYIFYT